MNDVTIAEFCKTHGASQKWVVWAKQHCKTGMMSEAYDKLSKSKNSTAKEFFNWVWPRAFDDKTLRLLAVRFVRETPLADGRKVFDLLTDPRSVNVLVVAERFALGLASLEELEVAVAAARGGGADAGQILALPWNDPKP